MDYDAESRSGVAVGDFWFFSCSPKDASG